MTTAMNQNWEDNLAILWGISFPLLGLLLVSGVVVGASIVNQFRRGREISRGASILLACIVVASIGLWSFRRVVANAIHQYYDAIRLSREKIPVGMACSELPKRVFGFDKYLVDDHKHFFFFDQKGLVRLEKLSYQKGVVVVCDSKDRVIAALDYGP